MATELFQWAQETLLTPGAVELVLRVGIVPGGDHSQYQLEVWSATDKVLIGMWSNPHSPLSSTPSTIANWLQRLEHEVLRYAPPFP